MLGHTALTGGVASETHTGSAGLVGAILSLSSNLSIIIYLVELEHRKLGGLVLVGDLLGLGVDLLLSLLSTTTQTEDQVQCGLLLNVIITKGAAILQLLTGENQTLLIRGDSLLVLDLGLDIIDAIGRLHLEGDGLTRQSLDEDLYLEYLERSMVRWRYKSLDGAHHVAKNIKWQRREAIFRESERKGC